MCWINKVFHQHVEDPWPWALGVELPSITVQFRLLLLLWPAPASSCLSLPRLGPRSAPSDLLNPLAPASPGRFFFSPVRDMGSLLCFSYHLRRNGRIVWMADQLPGRSVCVCMSWKPLGSSRRCTRPFIIITDAVPGECTSTEGAILLPSQTFVKRPCQSNLHQEGLSRRSTKSLYYYLKSLYQ